MLGQMMQMPLTIPSLLDHAARYHGRTPIVSVETEGGKLRRGWQEVASRARQLASVLRRRGIGKGDKCATLAWNNLRHLECYFGLPGAGIICHTVNPRLYPEQLTYILNHANDRVLFFDKSFLPLVAGLRPSLRSIETYVLLSDHDAEAAAQFPDLEFFDPFIADGDQDAPWAEIDEAEASSLCYTSGTTGHPKGVLYSHRSTVLHSFAAALPDVMDLSACEIMMPVVPMFHVNAWGIPYAAALTGARLVLPGPRLDGESLSRLMADEGVTVSAGVPTVWQGMLIALERHGTSVPTLQRLIVGGSACPPSMMARLRELHGVDVIHLWGMTELSPLGTANTLLGHHQALDPAEQARRRECQGRPPYGIELKLVDDAGRRLPEDGVAQGHLRVRGPWVVADYLGAPAGSTLCDDGWFQTGDIASIDADGFMTIRDRSKDIVKSGGEWISTVELEGIALGHPDILDAAAIAARHEKWGERPVLLAVKKADSALTEAGLTAYFAGKLAKWQIPDRVIFVDALPRNATGKILKTSLRDAYGDILL